MTGKLAAGAQVACRGRRLKISEEKGVKEIREKVITSFLNAGKGGVTQIYGTRQRPDG